MRIGAVCGIAFLAACSMHNNGAPLLPAQGAMRAESGALIIRVTVPHHRFRADYISPATRGMTVDISGPTAIKKTVGLTLSASECKSKLMTIQCTLTVTLSNCPSKSNCYTASVVTYDGYNPKTGTIPKSAHKLSAQLSFGFWIGSTNTVVPLVLEGIPASVAFVPNGSSTLSGNQKSGYILDKCKASDQTVSVLGVDADGNYIVGLGAPAASLDSDDPKQLAAGKSSQPGTFTLSPPKKPAYPFGNRTITLTATVKPGAESGGKTKTAKITVTYSGEICGILDEFEPNDVGTSPYSITAGPDGNLWYDEDANEIVRMSVAGKNLKAFKVPTGSSVPDGIAIGPDGNLWFAEFGAGKIGRMTTAGTFKEFPLPSSTSGPTQIVTGPDHRMWFTEYGSGTIGRITTDGSMLQEFGGLTGAHPFPEGIIRDNSNVWFAESGSGRIASMTTSGALTEYPMPGATTQPFALAVGPDKAFWVTTASGSAVYRATAGGTFTSKYAIPSGTSRLYFIVKGPDGALWFTEFDNSKVARISLDGTIKEYPTLTSNSAPRSLVVGPDGAIWFTEFFGSKIGRLR